MNKNYMIKLNNNHRVKIRKNEVYSCDYSQGFGLSFQEQPAHRGEKNHTHIWIDNEAGEYVLELWSVFNSVDNLVLPLKTGIFAFLTGFEIVDDKLEGPNYKFELVIYRKLSESLIHDVEEWFFDLTEVTLNRLGVKSLFGEIDEVD